MATAEVASELLGRLDSVPVELCGELSMLLERACDRPQNLFSAAHLRGQFARFHHCQGQRIDVRDRTIVDLGCGSKNPLSLLLVDVLLGARRGIGIDLDGPRLDLALPGMLRTASYLLTDPRLIVGNWPITREQVAHNVGSLDLLRLWNGDVRGLDADRLSFRQEAAVPTSLADGEADIVYSNSFLEHVCGLDNVAAELARVTRPGGLGIHYIDGTDHRRYQHAGTSALDFLRVETEDELVGGCNRVRPLQFVAVFERHDFEVVEVSTWNRLDVGAAERATFAERFRSMPDEWLRVAETVICVRRR